jgi:hypothetical protein
MTSRSRSIKQQVIAKAKALLAELCGSGTAAGEAKAVLSSAAFTLEQKIKEQFIVKSRGGTGDDGISWKPLSKAYLAYGRRFAKGEQASLKSAAGLGKGNRFAPGDNNGLLTAAQLKRWRKLYAGALMRMGGSEDAGDKGKAAAYAWAQLKREGAKTKLDVYGNRKVEMLRDTGNLLASLGHSVDNGELRIRFDAPYAKAVLSRRPAWPLDEPIPDSWMELVRKSIKGSITALLTRRLQDASGAP